MNARIKIKLLSLLVVLTLVATMEYPPIISKAASNYVVAISAFTKTMKIGDTYNLVAVTSTGKLPRYKSSASSIASVNRYGLITAKKAGSTVITVKTTKNELYCKVTVVPTTITLSTEEVNLYKGGKYILSATTSNNHKVTFKSNRTSVATVDKNGVITAKKHGEATITVTCDGESETCEVIVEQPTITLNSTSMELKVGEIRTLKAFVSSGNKPTFSTSNQNVVKITKDGKVTARKKGRAYLYASEDGVKVSCMVTVTD